MAYHLRRQKPPKQKNISQRSLPKTSVIRGRNQLLRENQSSERYQTKMRLADRQTGTSKLPDCHSFKDLDLSRKVVKTTRVATPGRADRTTNAEDSLPTPDTGGRVLGVASGSRSRMSRGGSAPPQLSDAIIMRNERKSSLSAEVLKLIR
ncbi:hypothetical protein L207DRAFT_592463 [Hyaloscypha variabilis F]|uniref:Uncharacterized protein n=1 Tax=Hyaloscypha variabilis (strain UAMH 11265 / GT02V1 / F) TaxID=1149755 RepID=A0A2J6QVP6_HYAVF|nr:hypothetical protein L207DRAFT_592463 [Hyaloscypha variabilis F]